MNRSKSCLLVLALLALVAWAAPRPAQATGVSGFNPVYIEGKGTELLTNANWTAANKAKMEADIDQMASLGTGIVRIMIWPECSGMIISQNAGGYLNSDYNEIVANIPDLIRLYQERGIKVDVAFGNDFLNGGPNGSQSWWQWAFGTGGFANFEALSLQWMQGIVSSIEASPYAANVIFYDYHNEVSSNWGPNVPAKEYVAYMWDWAGVPAAKKGCSINTDYIDDFNYLLGTMQNRPLKMVDFHAYPNSTTDVNYNIESTYDKVKAKVPAGWGGSTVIMGEFGQGGTSWSETGQSPIYVGLLNKASAKGIPYYMAWDFEPLQGYGPGTACGFSFYQEWYSDPYNWPKDMMGGWSVARNLCYNPDMETTTGVWPSNWTCGSGGGPITGSYGGPSQSDSATNQRYYRISATVYPDDIYALSPYINVTGGKYLYINSFIRSNCSNLYIAFHQYDANNNYLGFTAGPSFNPPTWQFYNYQRMAGPWRVQLAPTAAKILVGVCGHVYSNPTYLDIDCISVNCQ